MARIAGVDLPRNKRVEIGLRYIYGIGRSNARTILDELKIDRNTKTDKLTEDQVLKLRDIIEKNYMVEGDLRRQVSMNIKRLVDLGAYRGLRHRKNLPVHGQRTRSNARTRKGPRKTVAVKKSIKAMKG
ncbi:MAG: 30S ribosomal protein S13 [Deltaproteobacteria bacterium]|nr:30S ribosomal protein S13 [Deltaproteobacteria bacterium]MBI3017107.1 30S ribosomal protein S13 [Deltaproteobacteria bacterium]